MGFGQFVGNDWIHVVSEESDAGAFWKEYAQVEYNKMLANAPGHALSMYKAHSEARVCFMQTRLDQSTLRTCVVQKSSRKKSVKLEIFREGEWVGPDVDVGGIFPTPMYYFRISIDIPVQRKLMIQTVTGEL